MNPNCFECRHLLIRPAGTFPYVCRRYGFESSRFTMPSLIVLEAVGSFCLGFEPKEVPAEKAPILKFVDPEKGENIDESV